MKILAVEDEPSIARIIKSGLSRSGYVVDLAEDGAEAKERVEIYDYDIIILDVMLPEADGYEVCRHIRQLGLDSKIIMLTAKDDLDSKVRGLNLGADDYMTKPFSLEELEARIRALSRREKIVAKNKLRSHGLELDLAAKKAFVRGKILKTTLIEFRILEYLVRHRGIACTRTMLQENIWGDKNHISNVMTATISRLRSKIRLLNKGQDIILTVPKSGYILN